jgi:general secretion pathway protein D
MRDRSSAERRTWMLALGICLAAALASGCAASTALRAGERAEQLEDYDRAVVEYTNALRANPEDLTTRLSLDRAKMRAAQAHSYRARRFAAAERYEEALVEYQLSAELNPTDVQVDSALREVRQKLRAKDAASRGGKTDLQLLIERARAAAPPGLELPAAKLPDSLTFRAASSRAVFRTIAQFGGLNILFDPAFREETIDADLKNMSLTDAFGAVTSITRTFYRVSAQRTVTVIPDTPAKRREYEDSVVQTLFLSNADLKEVIDLLRIVVDVRQITGVTALNAVALQDTPEHLAAATRLIEAIDKAKPEIVIDVELLEVDRSACASSGSKSPLRDRRASPARRT